RWASVRSGFSRWDDDPARHGQSEGSGAALGVKAVVFVAASMLAAGAGILAQAPPPASRSSAVVRLDPALDALIAPDAALETIRDDLGITEGPVWRPDGKSGYPVSPE